MTKEQYFKLVKLEYNYNGMRSLDIQYFCDNYGNPICEAWGRNEKGDPEIVDEHFSFDEFYKAMEEE